VSHSFIVYHPSLMLLLTSRTFAMLLLPQTSCSRGYWIASLSLIATAFVTCFLAAVTYHRSEKVRSWVAGHHGDSIESVMSKVGKATRSSPECGSSNG